MLPRLTIASVGSSESEASRSGQNTAAPSGASEIGRIDPLLKDDSGNFIRSVAEWFDVYLSG